MDVALSHGSSHGPAAVFWVWSAGHNIGQFNLVAVLGHKELRRGMHATRAAIVAMLTRQTILNYEKCDFCMVEMN